MRVGEVPIDVPLRESVQLVMVRDITGGPLSEEPANPCRPTEIHRRVLRPARLGDVVGTWRRAAGTVTTQSWRRLSRAARDAVEAEAESLLLPDIKGRVVVRWDD